MSGKVTEILTERGTTHGNFADNSAVSQAIKYAIEHSLNWQKLEPFQRESLHMIAHKMGRICAGDPDFQDHWDDIAGYSSLVSGILKTRAMP